MGCAALGEAAATDGFGRPRKEFAAGQDLWSGPPADGYYCHHFGHCLATWAVYYIGRPP
jgi:hypothetical protein